MARSPGRPPKYAHKWKEWLSGEPQTLTQGFQFDCTPLSMQKQLQREIRERGLGADIATRLEGNQVHIVRPRVRSKDYPWDDWLDGEKHGVMRGQEFLCNHNHFIIQLRRAARIRGLRVMTRTREQNGVRVVVFKAVPR